MKGLLQHTKLIIHPLLLTTLLIMLFIPSYAQTLKVDGFSLLENDLTANTRGTLERDQNGEIAALIKVVTTETGFMFDIGMLGVVKTVPKPGEIWVYVPNGTQRITISHPKYEVLRNYYFDIPIERGRTYELRLNTGHPIQYDSSKKQKITIKVTPPGAKLILNGMGVELDTKGEAVKEMSHGVFSYQVEAVGFYPKEDRFIVDENHTTLIIDDMKPITGKLSVRVNPLYASVKVDGHIIGNSSVEPVELQIGQHEVEVSANGYKTEVTAVNITVDQTYVTSITLSQVAVYRFTSTPAGANIIIDRQNIGSSPCSRELTSGSYQIKATKPGYKDFNKRMQLNSSDPMVNITLKKIYNYKNEIYIEGNVRNGSLVSIGGTLGAYVSNLNLEASILTSSTESEIIYWSGNNSQPYPCNYKPYLNVSGKVGYGVSVGTRIRITPQTGINFIKLKESAGAAYADGAYAISGLASVRLSAAIINHLAISVSPEYDFGLYKSKGYTALSDVSPKIWDWCSGFFIKYGLTIFL